MANSQKYNVTLDFRANTQQAEKQLQALKSQLSNLVASTNSGASIGLTKELRDATNDVDKLGLALNRATTNIGTLDLGQFRRELKAGNLDAERIATSLRALGPEGVVAFNQLTNSLMTTEPALKRTNALLNNFLTTLKNTARYQISTAIYQAVISTVQKAYSYAKDLNESLTNIKIVTGQSTAQMAKFTKEAEKSAKALGTTVTAYTDASLIFYQQGLTGDEVTKRTDVVTKLANVTGQSASEISSYMTAIWNNFAEGSDNLEHFADVITALGASTAASSEEIAEGLEKFAAIGNTVGLSYEYAAAALAGVIANTRQSAELVGTSFKTIFSRLQSVSLGETLDDEVNLTKYSKALETVGVKVVDFKGQMRDMDDILSETAAKWDTLTKAQQVGLAQTVAGKNIRLAA